MSIKRYDLCHIGSGIHAMMDDSDGEFVMHEDYAALEQQLAESQSKLEKMAAENAELKSYASDCTNAVEFWSSYADAEDKITTVPETPVTDAFLAEVRASGVEMMIEECESDIVFIEPEDEEHYILMIEHAKAFAAQLRQGGAA